MPRNRNTLYFGEELRRNERITSLNNKYYVVFDGKHIRVGGDVGEFWNAGENFGAPRERIRVREDGEIEMFIRDFVTWKLGNAGKGNADCFYIIQDDGDFVLMNDGQQVWHTDTRRVEDGREFVVDRLHAGESMPQGKKIVSPNRRFELRMQGDGNLVLYDEGKAIWASGTRGLGWGCDVHDDDSFVVSGSDWSSGTRRRISGGKGELILQDDGKLIFKTDGYIIWSTDPGIVTRYPVQYSTVSNGVSQLKMTEYLSVNQYLTSPNGKFTATLQSDGDLVVRYKELLSPVWRSKTSPNSAVQRLQVQLDGNCVMIGASDSAIWATASDRGQGDAILKLNNDGCLSIKEWTSTKFPASSSDIQELVPGQALLVGQALTSFGGLNKLVFDETGMFTLTRKDRTKTYSLANTSGAMMLIFNLSERDGNPELTLRSQSGGVLWRASVSESRVNKAYRLKMERWSSYRDEMVQKYGERGRREAEEERPSFRPEIPSFSLKDDGTSALIRYLNDTVWDLRDTPSNDPLTDTIRVGDKLEPGDRIVSQDKSYQLVYQPDGNLVQYYGYPLGRTVEWRSKTQSTSPGYVTQNNFGQLVMYDSQEKAIWTNHSKRLLEQSTIITTLGNDGSLLTTIPASFGTYTQRIWSRYDD